MAEDAKTLDAIATDRNASPRGGETARPARAPDALARRLYGTDEPVPPSVSLRAGPLDLVYRAGKLLHIRLGEVEVWHGVAFPFRDPDWGTPEAVLDDPVVDTVGDGFRIVAEGAFTASPPIDLRLEISGDAGRIRFTGTAVPRGDVLTNRLGLCVLYPMAAAGRRIEVEHEDGRRSASTIPTHVPSWPAFTLVRAIRHEYGPGRWAHCVFDGDVFEFEDQRNNADASFKVYSRSNLMPRPYRLRAGAPIRHSAELRLEGAPARPSAPRRSQPVAVAVDAIIRSGPSIGIEVVPADLAPAASLRRALRELRPAFLHLAIEDDGPSVDWRGARDILDTLGATLRLDIVSRDGPAQRAPFDALSRDLQAAGLVPESVAVFPCEEDSVDLARARFPGSRIGGGTPHYFAQLNRLERLGPVDFVTFTSSPLVHGSDDDLVMLSLESLPSLLETVRARHPGLPIRIGPSGIGIRRSPFGRQPPADGTRRLALARRDPRSRGLYGAAWILGYAAQLAAAGAEAITLQSLTGDAGLVEVFESGDVVQHPPFLVLARLGGAASYRSVAVSDPGRVAALALVREAGSELLLANLTADSVEIAIEGWAADARPSVIGSEAWQGQTPPQGWDSAHRTDSATRLRLGPFAIASLRPETPGPAGGAP